MIKKKKLLSLKNLLADQSEAEVDHQREVEIHLLRSGRRIVNRPHRHRLRAAIVIAAKRRRSLQSIPRFVLLTATFSPISWKEYEFLSVDKECSPATSVLVQILGHCVFHAGSFLLELVIHAFQPCCSRPSSWSCPFHFVVYLVQRRWISSHYVTQTSKLAISYYVKYRINVELLIFVCNSDFVSHDTYCPIIVYVSRIRWIFDSSIIVFFDVDV